MKKKNLQSELRVASFNIKVDIILSPDADNQCQV
jgi:hypothetical protein